MARRVRVLSASQLRVLGHTGRIDLDDLVQDVLLRLQSGAVLERVASARNPLGYLLQIVRNAALDAVRRLRRETERYGSVPFHDLSPSLEFISFEQWAGSGEYRTLRLRRLREVLADLSEDDRRLLRWRFWEGRSTRDIAGELGASYSAVAVRIHRLLRRMRDDL
jgi:RNA polymerase sigma factor (sigma-70 family)